MATEGMLRQQMLHRFYADHHGWLNGWLRRQLGCSQRAADLAQDTFVRVLSKDDDMAAIREPRAYLHTIAKGLLINHWRRRQIEQAYLDALALQPEPVAPSPESQALIVETLLRIDAMLAQLKRAGVRLINETAQILPGRKMAFVHPKSANGVLIELYELTDSE